jgi:hypothetical protein
MLGSLFNASAVSLGVVTSSALISTEVIGVGERVTSVMVREPVTVIVDNSSSGTAAVCSCARAELECSAAETPSAIRDALKIAREDIGNPLLFVRVGQVRPPRNRILLLTLSAGFH